VYRVAGSDPEFPAFDRPIGHGGLFVRNLAAPLRVWSVSLNHLRFRSLPFHEGNVMSNKPHLRPHKEKRQASQTTRLLMAILVIAFFVLAIALEATGHVVFRGRLILGRGSRWLLMWCFSGVRASRAGFVLRPVQGPCVPSH
jgi:hypothetical protein